MCNSSLTFLMFRMRFASLLINEHNDGDDDDDDADVACIAWPRGDHGYALSAPSSFPRRRRRRPSRPQTSSHKRTLHRTGRWAACSSIWLWYDVPVCYCLRKRSSDKIIARLVIDECRKLHFSVFCYGQFLMIVPSLLKTILLFNLRRLRIATLFL